MEMMKIAAETLELSSLLVCVGKEVYLSKTSVGWCNHEEGFDW